MFKTKTQIGHTTTHVIRPHLLIAFLFCFSFFLASSNLAAMQHVVYSSSSFSSSFIFLLLYRTWVAISLLKESWEQWAMDLLVLSSWEHLGHRFGDFCTWWAMVALKEWLSMFRSSGSRTWTATTICHHLNFSKEFHYHLESPL